MTPNPMKPASNSNLKLFHLISRNTVKIDLPLISFITISMNLEEGLLVVVRGIFNIFRITVHSEIMIFLIFYTINHIIESDHLPLNLFITTS